MKPKKSNPFNGKARPVRIVTYENMDEVPVGIVCMGAFFDVDKGEGIFVNSSRGGITIIDCRQALGREVLEEKPQEFIDRILNERLRERGGGVMFTLD